MQNPKRKLPTKRKKPSQKRLRRKLRRSQLQRRKMLKRRKPKHQRSKQPQKTRRNQNLPKRLRRRRKRLKAQHQRKALSQQGLLKLDPRVVSLIKRSRNPQSSQHQETTLFTQIPRHQRKTPLDQQRNKRRPKHPNLSSNHPKLLSPRPQNQKSMLKPPQIPLL